MISPISPERDLSALRGIIAAWRRAEHAAKGGNRLARQLAMADLLELWRVEWVGWHADVGLPTASNGAFAGVLQP